MAMRRMITSLSVALAASACAPPFGDPQLPVTETSGTQEAFDLRPEALTLATARRLNALPFERRVRRGGLGQTANLVSEQSVLLRDPPPSTEPIPYRIGVGDDLQMVIYVTTRGMTDAARENTIARSARVSAEGSLLFIETGRIEVEGRTLSEARDVVGNALVRNGVDPRFQLEVSGFNSQKINLTVVAERGRNSGDVDVRVESGVKGTGSYPVTERPMTLRELLVTAGLEISRDGVQIVSIDRGGRRYQIPVEDVFAAGSPEYYLTGGDTVRIETFAYNDDRAFVFGGGSTPAVFAIAPEVRPTLADLLFVEGGALATRATRADEIYLLRGREPVQAYHLDASDPSRVMVASALELRPNDMVVLSKRPIIALSELLQTISPFAVSASGGAR